MNMAFTAIFLILILTRIYASAYAGPVEKRNNLIWGYYLVLALAFVVFVVLIARQVIQIANA